MKLGVITLTLNRLYYAYHCLNSLKKNAGYPYEHIIIDNGSTDGTYEWLKEEGYQVIRNEENKGITFALKQGVEFLKDKDIDLYIKIDSDCDINSPDILKRIVEFYELSGDSYSISPWVEGIDLRPNIPFEEKVGNFTVARTCGIGGIFRVMKKEIFEKMIKEVLLLDDASKNRYLEENKIKIGYLKDLIVTHYETTKGQEKRYLSYFGKPYLY
jgi:glycosyltransferase involved in cell wall biosynthesis